MSDCLRLSSPDFPVLFAVGVWVGLLFLTLWLWRRSKMPAHGAFLTTHLAMLWWLAGATFELASPTAHCKIFWAQVTWPAIGLMTTAWMFFLLDYTLGSQRPGPRLRLALLAAGPMVIAAMVATNPWHEAFYGAETRPVEIAGRLSIVYDHGPLFHVASAYIYLLLTASLTILCVSIWRAERGFRWFLLTLLAVTLVPIVANLAYILGGYTLFGFDPTPFMFVFVLAVFGVLLVNNRMMDVNVLTRDILYLRSGDPVVVIDAQGRLEGANPAARQVFGGRLPERGAPVLSMPGLGPIAADVMAETSPDEATIALDGRSFLVRSIALVTPMLPRRPALGWAIRLLDNTDQERLAETLRHAAESANAANAAKTQFVATISHELRTPLTSIKGSLDLLAGGAFGPLPDKAQDMVEIGLRNSQRLVALVNDLLDLQRIELDTMAIERVPVDLKLLVAEAVDAAGGYGHALGVHLTVTLPDGPTIVDGDMAKLMQVMANLLSNAMKFSETGGTVDVRLIRTGDAARIEVEDRGVGIPEEFRNRIFQPFSQADPSNIRKIAGAGLGLSITRRIIDELSGRIDFESTVGVGTTFIVELPLSDLGS
jgi:signal transduction histidine kinase